MTEYSRRKRTQNERKGEKMKINKQEVKKVRKGKRTGEGEREKRGGGSRKRAKNYL